MENVPNLNFHGFGNFQRISKPHPTNSPRQIHPDNFTPSFTPPNSPPASAYQSASSRTSPPPRFHPSESLFTPFDHAKCSHRSHKVSHLRSIIISKPIVQKPPFAFPPRRIPSFPSYFLSPVHPLTTLPPSHFSISTDTIPPKLTVSPLFLESSLQNNGSFPLTVTSRQWRHPSSSMIPLLVRRSESLIAKCTTPVRDPTQGSS